MTTKVTVMLATVAMGCAMVTAQALQEHGQVVEVVHLGDDLHQRLDQMIPLSRHRHGKHVPHLWVPQEQVGVEEQRKLVTVQRDISEALPQPGNVQRSRLS